MSFGVETIAIALAIMTCSYFALAKRSRGMALATATLFFLSVGAVVFWTWMDGAWLNKHDHMIILWCLALAAGVLVALIDSLSRDNDKQSWGKT